MALHRIHLGLADVVEDAGLTSGGDDAVGRIVTIGGEEAKHAARVKRLEPGERVELLTGQGGVCLSVFRGADKLGKSGWAIALEVERIECVEPMGPRVEMWTAVPKGPRLEDMVDQMAQAGAASWSPLDTKRAVVQPRQGKMDRLQRVAMEASKQSGRAWDLEFGRPQRLDRAASDNARVIVCDASGGFPPKLGGGEVARVLVGPEGGWEPDELERLRATGAAVCRFGPAVMRIETAAVVACGTLMATAEG